MSTHLYAVGEPVSLNFHERQFLSKLHPFTVEAQMPSTGPSLRYAVKSRSEPTRRVVAEHQLSAFGGQPGTMPVICVTPYPGGAS